MKEYLLYSQVQDYLDHCMYKTGVPVSFYDAVAALWQDGQCHRAPALPAVSFQEWDLRDMGDFRRRVGMAPMDMELFYPSLHSGHSAARSALHIPMLDVIPLKIAENQAGNPHRHSSFEMLYVLDGQAELYLNGMVQPFACGELCLIAPHYLHDITVKGNSVVISLTFAEHTIENTLYRLLHGQNVVADFFRASLSGDGGGCLFFQFPVDEQSCLLVRGIFHEGYCRQDYSQELCTSLIEILFSCLLRGCGTDYSRSPEERANGRRTSMLPIFRYIQANYRSCSLQQLAAHFHYEPSYMGKLIKTCLGKNYKDIVSELRLAEAKKLLVGSALSIKAIAEQCGFQSAVHFSRSFQQHNGLSPAAFRRQALK